MIRNCKHGTRRAFHQVYDSPSCAVREPELFQRTIHRFYRLWKAPGKHGHFQCDTAAGSGWETVLAGSADFPAVTPLLLKLQMVPQVCDKLDTF